MFKRKTALLLLIPICCVIWGWLTTPSPEKIKRLALGSDRVLLAADGTVLQTLRTDFSKRRLAWYPLSSFAKNLQDAVINVEDRRFYGHFGVDPFSLGRALKIDVEGHRRQGASTLTMQLSDLIQNKVLRGNQTIQKGSILHKLSQLWSAVFIEMKWSKAEILEAYLNLIHLRGEFQGVPAASYAYLNKHPIALDPAESFVIVAMISSPNQSATVLKRRSCLASHQNDAKNDARANCTDTDIATDKFFSKNPSLPASPGIAPHLARRLFNQNPHQSVLASTIDANLQREVIEILEKNIHRLKNSNVGDTAAIVIENKTGKVLAYVGTVASSDSPQVDGVTSYRQAGSSLKPFIYAKAIDTKRLTAASILLDEPTVISWGNDVYRPANYDKHFSGPVSAREALGSSLNVPAVKTVTILGLHQTYEVLQSIGLSNMKEPDFYGVSMALGAVEVRLDELANAYRMLANGGFLTPLRLTPQKPNNPAPGQRVLSPESTFIISSILSDPNARSIGFGWESPLETPFWTAVKTGTSKDYRDNWCMGFSELYTVGVWAGNFDAEAMEKVSGVSGVGPSWYEIITNLHRSQRSSPPQQPPLVKAKEIRHEWVSHLRKEYFIAGTEPAQEVIEPAMNKNVQFVFPAQNSILVKDPHMDQNNVALFVRFKGSVPDNSHMLLDKKTIGDAVSPFKILQPPSGDHDLAIVAADGHTLTSIHFSIRGAQ